MTFLPIPSVSKKPEIPLMISRPYSKGIDLTRFEKKISTYIPAFKSQYQDSFHQIKYQTTSNIKIQNHAKISIDQKNEHVDAILNMYKDIIDEFSFKSKIKFFIDNVKSYLKKIDLFLINEKISKFFKHLNHYFNIISLSIKPFDGGTNRIGLMFRSKKIEERKNEFRNNLHEYIVLISQDSPDINSLDHIKKNLDSELVSIRLEQNSIDADYKKHHLESVKYLVSNFAFLASYGPFKTLIDLAYILGKIPGLVEFLDFMLLVLNLKKSEEDKKIFNVWQENFLRINPSELFHLVKEDSNIDFSQFSNNSSWEELSDYIRNNRRMIDEKISKDFQSKSCFNKSTLKDRKIVQFAGSDIEVVLRSYFIEMNKDKFPEGELTNKFNQSSKIVILNEYINEQIALEKKFKANFTHLIKSKLKLENIFLDFRKVRTRISFGYSTLELSLILSGAALGMVFGPIGAFTGLVIGLFVLSTILNLSFWLAGYVIGSKYRSHSSGLLNMKIIFQQVRYEISNYWLQIKEQELQEKNSKFLIEFQNEKEEINGVTRKEIIEFLELNNKTQKLLNSLETLKSQRRDAELIDVENFANLPNGSLEEILKLIDFDLLEKDFVGLLKAQLGLDIINIKKDLKILPKERVTKTLLKDFKAFFTLKEHEYISFMKYQHKRKELLNSSISL